MSITPGRKAEVIKTYATKAGDTGSPEVQVAILSERINSLDAFSRALERMARLSASFIRQ